MSERKKIVFDFAIRSSPAILFNFLTTPEGLTQWFADHVDSIEDDYKFSWDGSEEEATIIEFIEDHIVKYKMEDSEEGEFLEFRIEKSEISNDTILFITEFLEDYDVEDQQIFWNTQISRLKGSIGASN